MSNNFFEALHQIATDKGIPRDEIENIVESAMLSAFKKQYGAVENVRVAFDRDKNTVQIVTKKMVVRKPNNLAEEIAYERAVKIKKDVNLGDEIYVEENPFDSFGRIAAQTAKQVIIQKIKEAEKNIIFNEFNGREGDLITVTSRGEAVIISSWTLEEQRGFSLQGNSPRLKGIRSATGSRRLYFRYREVPRDPM